MYVFLLKAGVEGIHVAAVDAATARRLDLHVDDIVGRPLTESVRSAGKLLEALAHEVLSQPAEGPMGRSHGLRTLSLRDAPEAMQIDSIRHGDSVCLTLRAVDQFTEDQPLMARCFAGAADVVLVVDAERRLMLANSGFATALGYRPSALRGRDVLELVHPDDRESSREGFARVAAGRPENGLDCRFRASDGHYRWYRWRATPPVAAGEPVFAVARDVTEERGREDFQSLVTQALRRIEQGVVLTDARGHVCWCNHMFEQMTGYALAELQGQRLGPRLQGLDTDRVEAARLSEQVRKGKPFRSELLNYRKSGEPFWVRIEAEPTVDAHGERYFVAIETDITDERRQRQELLASEARLRATLDGAHEAIYWLESVRDAAGVIEDFRFVEVNPVAERELSRTREELLGRTICDLFPINRTGDFFEQYQRVAETREPLSRRYEIPEGHAAPGHYHQRVVPVLDGVAIFNTDISAQVEREAQQRRMQRELLRSQRLKALGQLASGIAHDFNNVLATILMAAESLRDRVQEDSEALQTVEDISAASSRASEFVAQIMAFSRRGNPTMAALNPAEVLEQSCRMLRRMLPQGVQLEVSLEREVRVEADRAQLEQVLTNLVTNAWHAMGTTGGTLRVTLSAASAHPALPRAPAVAILCVADDGPGMDQQTLERVREPFFSTKESGLGTGLGLAVVDRIVSTHGGELHIESRLGKGTKVEVVLPALTPVSMASRQPPPPAPPARAPEPERRTTVLFVDDEDRLRTLVSRALGRQGFEIIAVGTPVQALDVVRTRGAELDCAMLDYDLPGQTGIELADTLRRLLSDLPVLLLTGGGIGQEAKRSPHITRICYKPCGVEDLARELRITAGAHG